MTVDEIMRRVQEDGHHVYDGPIRSHANELAASGEVERVKEPRSAGSTEAWRWRYSRKTTLSPEIEALQRELDGDG